MKNIKKTVFLSMIALTTLTATSCKKEEASQATPETFFALDFYRGADSNVDVYFSANDISVIPEVTINGDQVVDLDVDGYSVFGSFNNLPYSDEMTYSISANGKSISGTVSIPDTLSNVTVNDEAIYIRKSKTFDLSSALKFEWDKPVADFVRTNYYNRSSNSYVKENLDTDTYTVPVIALSYNAFNISITNISGVKLIPGATPNVSGDYGKGYVTAETKSEYSLESNNQFARISRKNDSEKKFEKFKADFKALLEAK